MATIDFNTVPSGVTLNEECAQHLSDRAAETATTFSRKVEKLQNTVMDARNNHTWEAEEFITSASRLLWRTLISMGRFLSCWKRWS